jgi:16S rRNA (cytosine1407-C5)-methyltransferase
VRSRAKEHGTEAFDRWYAARFGGRWPLLRESLRKPAEGVPYHNGLVKPYLLDKASIRAAEALTLPDEGCVLDACAAPGGKSLVIASRMGSGVTLLSNELSGERRRRLVNVLDEHLDEARRARVTVSGFDASAAGGRATEQGRFAAILLDAPCSSERHVLQNEHALAQWAPARPRSLARRQWALLSSCFLMLRPGGALVYSTCALSEEENDGVVSRLMEKYGGEALLDEPDFPEGERTTYGRIILPDTADGMGPMYVAKVKKRNKAEGGSSP